MTPETFDPKDRWDVTHGDEQFIDVEIQERRVAGRVLLACIRDGRVVAYLQGERIVRIVRTSPAFTSAELAY